MKRIALFAAAAALVLAFGGCSDEPPTGPGGEGFAAGQGSPGADGGALRISASADDGVSRWMQTYEVVVENLTPATEAGASQPFSPPVLATHRRDFHMFRVGRFASDELALIAEDAVNGPMLDLLENSGRVFGVVAGDAPIPPGGQARFEIQTAARSRGLSLVFMLVNTNDGFGGLDNVRLPLRGEKVYYVRSYDAGFEENTELAADIPGPCCGSAGVGPDEHRRIRHHAGITGAGDLEADDYGWTDPVAKLTVTRIK